MDECIKHDVFGKSILFNELDVHCFDIYSKAYNESYCPLCMFPLNKIPKVSCKCKNCKNTVFVRISPFENRHLLLDEKGVWKLDYIRDSLINRRFIYNMVDILHTENENITESYLSHKSITEHKTLDRVLLDEFYKQANNNTNNAMLGLMRNNWLNIAYILKRYDSVQKALQAYFAVMYMDILGYINESYYSNNILIKTPYVKHPEYSFVAPAVLDDIIKLLKSENYRIEHMYETYREGVFQLPITIEENDVLITWWKIIDIVKDRYR